MKKLLSILCFVSGGPWAESCDKLSKIADDNDTFYGNKYSNRQ